MGLGEWLWLEDVGKELLGKLTFQKKLSGLESWTKALDFILKVEPVPKDI